MGSGLGPKSPAVSKVSREPVQPGEDQRGALALDDLWAFSGQPQSDPDSEANSLGMDGHP